LPMTEEVAEILKKAMALPPEARTALASSLLKSLSETPDDNGENSWVSGHREKARAGLSQAGRVGFMEAYFRPVGAVVHKTQPELLRAAESASIHAFGWPIGVVLHTEQGRPKPLSEGIVAEIGSMESSYDYWALRTNGDFYFLGSLFEDERTRNAMWFDTRIMRATETFLFCYRLYKALGVPEESAIRISLRHGGLRDRVLGSAKPSLWALNRTSREEEVEWRKTVRLELLRTELRETVKASLDPLFVLFDFFEPPDRQVYSEVDGFLKMVSSQQQPFEL
jgi:hypothetical protein